MLRSNHWNYWVGTEIAETEVFTYSLSRYLQSFSGRNTCDSCAKPERWLWSPAEGDALFLINCLNFSKFRQNLPWETFSGFILLFLPHENPRLLDSSLRIFGETEQGPGLLYIANLNWVKAIKHHQLIEIRTFWRCFLNITKSWGKKKFVEETIKPKKGVCTPAPFYLIFKLCLIYFDVSYTLNDLSCCFIHVLAAPLRCTSSLCSPSVQRSSNRHSEKRLGITTRNHRKSSAIVTAHSLAMQPWFVLAAAFPSVA